MRLAAALALMACSFVAAGASAFAQSAAEAEDALARYLESRELRVLQTRQLERMLERAAPDDRAEIAERLATLYAEALDGASTPEERAALEQRARALLDLVPEGQSLELRVSVLRVSYARAERAAERWRLRLASPAELEEAQRILRTAAPEFARIGAQANSRVVALERQEESARELELDILRDALNDARRVRSVAMYLAGWAHCYLAELTNDAAPAAEAARCFGWLLNAEPNQPASPERVGDSSMRFEHVARAALGAGSAAAVRAAHVESDRWFDLVEKSTNLPSGVREELFARRLTAAARADNWPEAQRVVEARRNVDSIAEGRGRAPDRLTANEARLLAVLTFEASERSAQTTTVNRLRDAALADLVARDELAHVVDLANRYGVAQLPERGFIGAYVRAVHAYQRAREAHDALGPAEPDAPVRDGACATLYAHAAEQCRMALASEESRRFPDARADAARTLAFSLYFASGVDATPERALEAAKRFLDAAAADPGTQAGADAHWMAIRANEHAGAYTGRDAIDARERRERLLQEFIERYPADRRAGAALVRRSIEGVYNRDEAIDALLRVPSGAPAYDHARREAARLLYDAVREASPARRAAAARRFADVAAPLLDADRQAALGGDDARAAANALVLARQLLDALLGVDPPDAARARVALGAIDALRDAGLVASDAHLAETLYRRVQIALASNDDEDAELAAADLHALGARAAEARYAHAANRLLYLRALSTRRADPAREGAARAVLRHGARVLADLGVHTAEGPLDAQAMSVLSAAADAAAWLWRERRDEAARDAALRVLRVGLRSQPRNAAFLRTAAELAESAGDDAAALDAWRTLLSGADVGSDPWFEARWRVFTILARTDSAAAIDGLRAHTAVYPDYGPAPWGERLRALHASLTDAGSAAR